MPACTSPTLHPPSPPHCSSIVMTSTVRVNSGSKGAAYRLLLQIDYALYLNKTCEKRNGLCNVPMSKLRSKLGISYLSSIITSQDLKVDTVDNMNHFVNSKFLKIHLEMEWVDL